MQLDSILSDQLSSSTIQPSEPVLHTSDPSDLDCSRAFENSLPPFLESIINDKLSRASSSSNILSSKLANSKRNSNGSNKDGIENEGTAESTECQQSLLLSIQNDALPLDHKTPTDPTRLQEQEQQQQEKHPHQQHLVLLKMCSYPSSACSLTPLSAEDPSRTEQSSPETASLFNHRGADPTRKEQERLLSEPQLPGDKDLESILKSPSLAQHPHIVYPACLATTTTNHGALHASALTGAVNEDIPSDSDQTPQNPVPPQLPSHQQAPAPTGTPYARTHADTSVAESTINNSSHVSLDTCAFLFSAQSNIRTFSTNAASSPGHMTNPKGASKAKVSTQSTTVDGNGKDLDIRCDSDYMSDDMVDSLAIGAEKRRPTGAESETSMFKKRKRSKGQDKTKSRISISAGTTTHLLQFLERRLGRSSFAIPADKSRPSSTGYLTKVEPVLTFDPSTLVRSWSIPRTRNGTLCSAMPQRLSPFRHKDHQHSSSHVCKQQHTSINHCQCRKRFFVDAIELGSPLRMNALSGDQYPGWIDSVKKRKIHQFATKWTSTLSPSPYLKLLTVRNFWDVMSSRLDLSWLDERKIQVEHTEQPSEECSSNTPDIGRSGIVHRQEREQCLSMKEHGKDGRIVRQYACPTQFLKGLWEEELREQRVRQMIPDTVRRPPRNRIFNSRPIAFTKRPPKPCLPSLLTPSPSTPSEINVEASTDTSDSSASTGSKESGEAAVADLSPQPALAELDLMLKKKHRATAIVRSHAIAEGSDMSDYKPWKDGTVTPHRGSLSSLKELRSNIMDPWPAEETRSRDECSRILHRMREQLNVVINLQIHLRSMIKTAPTQLSFLLSIRHPAQVSIELLLALYGPHFTQTSNFRAIEQLLWGSHSHSQPQPQADTSSSGSLLHV
ncbi:hypothetical protein BGZ72_008474 [Mortierella alpina]|nr:hypothetical protein BGZ72_008474 [Mortierella alpina]